MANLEKTVKVVFYGDDKMSRTVTSIAGKMDTLDRSVGNVTGPMSDLADSILKVEGALIAMVGAGLVYAIIESTKFETSSVNLSKILGEEKDQIERVEDAVLSLSNKYGQAATGILESTTDFKRAGFNVNESLSLAKAGIDLVIGAAEAELDVARSTEVIISVLKGFKAPVEDAVRLTDILNTVSNEYATSVNELGTGMAELSPIAGKMGFSLEETAGILTPVIEIFRSGSEASQALKMGLLKLIDDALPVRTALESIGVAQHDANGNLRSGRDILFDVAKAFETVDEDQKLFVTSQLVGIRQAAKMVEVFDGLKYSTEITGRALDATGSIALEVAEKMKTAEVKIARFREGFVNLSIVVGDEFKEAAKEAIDGGTAIENTLQKLVEDGTFEPIFAVLRKFGNELGDYLKDIAEAMPEAFGKIKWDPILDSFENLRGAITTAFKAIFGDVDLTTDEGLSSVIQKIIDAVTALNNISAGIIKGFGPFLEMISTMIQKFTQMDQKTIETVGHVLGFARGIETLRGALGLLQPAMIALTAAATLRSIQLLFAGITSGAGAAANATTGLSIATKGLIGGAKLGLIGAAAASGYFIGEGLRKIFPAIDEGAQAVLGFVDKLLILSETQKRIAAGLKVTADGAEKAAREIDEIAKKIDKVPEDIKTEIIVSAKTDEAIAVYNILKDIPESKNVKASIEVEGIDEADRWWKLDPEIRKTIIVKSEGVEEVKQEIEEISYWRDGREFVVEVPVKWKNPEDLKKVIEETIPTEKQIEIKLQGEIDKDIAEIKAKADTLQAAMEFTATMNIAEVEASARRIEAIAGTLNTVFESTGKILDTAVGALAGLDPSKGNWIQLKVAIERQMNKENLLREKALAITEEQARVNNALAEAKTRAIEKGDGLITIQADGMEPQIEAFMWEILERIQIRANEVSSEYLLGFS